jgi:hypothetical protein
VGEEKWGLQSDQKPDYRFQLDIGKCECWRGSPGEQLSLVQHGPWAEDQQWLRVYVQVTRSSLGAIFPGVQSRKPPASPSSTKEMLKWLENGRKRGKEALQMGLGESQEFWPDNWKLQRTKAICCRHIRVRVNTQNSQNKVCLNKASKVSLHCGWELDHPRTRQTEIKSEFTA